MDTTIGLFVVGSIIIFGLVAQFIFKKTKFPDVLLLIAAGTLLSRFGLAAPIKESGPELIFFITFSLIYVVFYGALPIKLKALFSTMKYSALSSILNFILVTGLLGIIAKLLGFSWTMSFALGALFCVLDGSIINGLLEHIKVSKKAEAQIQSESAIIDTLVIVGVLTIINFSSMSFGEVTQSLASYIFLSFGIGLVMAMIWSLTLEKIGHYASAPIATMAILVMLFAFAEYVKANGVITVFSFAIILGNVTVWKKILYKKQEQHAEAVDLRTKRFYEDLSFLIRTFLFVYLGMLVDFSAWPYLLAGLGFFFGAYMIRSMASRVLVNKELTKKERFFLDAMSAKGLTPTVIIAMIAADSKFANIAIGGIFSSVLITSVLLFLIEKDKFTSFSEIMLTKVHPVNWCRAIKQKFSKNHS